MRLEVSEIKVISFLRNERLTILHTFMQNCCSSRGQSQQLGSWISRNCRKTDSFTQWVIDSLIFLTYWKYLATEQMEGWGRVEKSLWTSLVDLLGLSRQEIIWLMRLGTMFLFSFFHSIRKRSFTSRVLGDWLGMELRGACLSHFLWVLRELSRKFEDSQDSPFSLNRELDFDKSSPILTPSAAPCPNLAAISSASPPIIHPFCCTQQTTFCGQTKYKSGTCKALPMFICGKYQLSHYIPYFLRELSIKKFIQIIMQLSCQIIYGRGLYIETEDSNDKIFLGLGYNGGLVALGPAVFGCFSKKIRVFGSDGGFQRWASLWGWPEVAGLKATRGSLAAFVACASSYSWAKRRLRPENMSRTLISSILARPQKMICFY